MLKVRTVLGLMASVAALTLATGAEARAAFGVFDFDSTVVEPAGGEATLPGGDSALVFTPNAGANINGTLTGGADIIIGRVAFTPGATPTTSTAYSVDFQFEVVLTDQDSGESDAVLASGTITGMFMGGGTPAINSQIINYNVAPTSLTLGSTVYLVDIATSSGPGSVSDDGVLRLNVRAVPEPGSLALAGVGLVGLMGLRWRRRLQAIA